MGWGLARAPFCLIVTLFHFIYNKVSWVLQESQGRIANRHSAKNWAGPRGHGIDPHVLQINFFHQPLTNIMVPRGTQQFAKKIPLVNCWVDSCH
jgi:hypothetical protein